MSYFRREDIVGKTVIDSEAKMYGKVKDLAFLVSGEVAFLVEKADGSEEAIPISRVAKIGDFILLKAEKPSAPMPPTTPPTTPERPAARVAQVPPPSQQPQLAPQPTQAGVQCSSCGFMNPPDAKFCVKCGAPLPQRKKGLRRFLPI